MTRGEGKLWGGRFAQATEAAVERFTASIHFDRALARYDLRVSTAHAEMLQRAGLIPPEDAAALRDGLARIAVEVEDDRIRIKHQGTNAYILLFSNLTSRASDVTLQVESDAPLFRETIRTSR